jgi:hypothetical protein
LKLVNRIEGAKQMVESVDPRYPNEKSTARRKPIGAQNPELNKILPLATPMDSATPQSFDRMPMATMKLETDRPDELDIIGEHGATKFNWDNEEATNYGTANTFNSGSEMVPWEASAAADELREFRGPSTPIHDKFTKIQADQFKNLVNDSVVNDTGKQREFNHCIVIYILTKK